MALAFDPVGTKCASGPQPGAVALRDDLLKRFPQGHSLGIFNCRNVKGSSKLSVHSEGRAFDFGFKQPDPNTANPIGDQVFTFLIEQAGSIGIQLVIWNRQCWSAKTEKVKPFKGGAGPHLDHLHIELCRAAAERPGAGGPPAAAASAAPAAAKTITLPERKGEGPMTTVSTTVPTLARGAEGVHVAKLQNLLNLVAGQQLEPDGHFGNATDQAVRDFQRFFDLPVTGEVDDKVWGLLFSLPL